MKEDTEIGSCINGRWKDGDPGKNKRTIITNDGEGLLRKRVNVKVSNQSR